MQRLRSLFRSLFRSRTARIALAVVVLNEIRGLIVVAGVLSATHGRIW